MGHRRKEILKSIKPTLIFFAVAFSIMAFMVYRAEVGPGNATQEQLDKFADIIDQLYADNAVMNTYASTSAGQVHGMAYLNKCGRQFVVYDNKGIDLSNLQGSIDVKPNIAYATIGQDETIGALRGDYTTDKTTWEPWLNYLRLIQRVLHGEKGGNITKSIFTGDVQRRLVTDNGVEDVWAEEKILQIEMSYNTFIELWLTFGEEYKTHAEYTLVGIRPYIKDIRIVIWTDMTTERFGADVYAYCVVKDDNGKEKEIYRTLATTYTALLTDPWEMDGVLAGPDTTKEYPADSLYRIIVNDLQPVTGKINTRFREKKAGIEFNLLNADQLKSLGYVREVRYK